MQTLLSHEIVNFQIYLFCRRSYNDWKFENHFRFENSLHSFSGSKIQVSFPYRFKKKCREETASELNDFGNRWCKRQYVEPNALKEWKVSIFKIVDQRIKFHSQNTNLLPPKPKSTFRHLRRVSRTFRESMFWFQQTRLQTTLLLFDCYIILTL